MKTRPNPSLPLALAETSGALLGRTVHVVGGTRVPGAVNAEKVHLMLNLDALEKGWQQEIFPGPARILAVSAVQSGAFFVMSGAALAPDAEGKPKRTYLRDAWRYDPTTGWQAIPEMPRAALAAPSPAPMLDNCRFLIIGGDEGSHAGFQPPSAHPGFSRTILAYDTSVRSWTARDEISDKFPAPVTTPTTLWRNLTIIPGGEVRPGIRTPRVVTFSASAPAPSAD